MKNQNIIILIGLILINSHAFGELKIENIAPSQSKLGVRLETVLTGTGFDENTRVSIFPDIGNKRRIISNWETSDEVKGVAVSGNYAYVADRWEGLKVIDISNPYDPKLVGAVNSPENESGIQAQAQSVTIVKDKFAYLPVFIGGDVMGAVHVIDISNPSNPNLISTVETPNRPYEVVTEGDYAYVAIMDGGVLIMDIRQPFMPRIVTLKHLVYNADLELYTDVTMGLAVKDNILCVANGPHGLQIADVSDPQNPNVIGSADIPETSGLFRKVKIAGDFAYVADFVNGLRIIDISTPSDPKIIRTVAQDILGDCFNVAPDTDKLYVAAAAQGLQILDISDPYNPVVEDSVDTPGRAEEAVISSDLAYVADRAGGLQIIEVKTADSSTANFISRLNTPGSAKGITVSGSIAYIADGGALQLIDISNKAYPKIISSLNTPGSATEVVVENGTAYVADGESGLQIIDVSDPYNPKRTGSADTPGSAADLVIADGIAYVSDGTGGLQLIEILDPSAPKIIGVLDTQGPASDAAVADKIAYVSVGKNGDHGGGLRIADISVPTDPKIKGYLNTENAAVGVAVAGDTVYLAETNRLQAIDVSDPSNPAVKWQTEIPETARGLTLAGDTAYIPYTTVWDGGLHVIDVKSSAPTFITAFSVPEEADDVSVVGDTAYMACGLYGKLIIMPVPVSVTPHTVSDTSLSLSIPAPRLEGTYTLKVFNDTEQDELAGAVTFAGLPVSKAIIVAGCGPLRRNGTGNKIWEATQNCANYACRTLLDRKYAKENIRYLSPATDTDADGDGISDVYGDATSDNLSDAIHNWVSIPDNPADELLIYIIDHGGDGYFVINSNEAELQAADLDKWLDDLQETLPGRLIIIYDACYSGTFIPLMRPPEGKERIVITSASDEAIIFDALGGMKGALTFSFQFWGRIREGYELKPAFLFAKDVIKNYQSPCADADGNGISENTDIKYGIENIVIGSSGGIASLMPQIKMVSDEQTLNRKNTATIWAEAATDTNEVWAVITPPDYIPESPDEPITDLPVLALTDPDNDGKYEGVYDHFAVNGTYKINIYATDTDGNCSLPLQTAVIQTAAAQTCLEGDINGNGILDMNDAIIALKVLSGKAYAFQSECLIREIKIADVILILQTLTGNP